ncbi:hypothetical protein GCM10008959_34150 [Deinococcus seoulensis]|uniref:Uncharacterized protein n=1 Tax=Deinococcus seoulensis TaxID=1837379 RepID=A0ABQ2RWI4_9DEIO|nr:hypothetical protein [Deinococcus seoulensis]GGR69291.1 hypothetical protein GCM10008959_34150 [Deinococcus seoulensis]
MNEVDVIRSLYDSVKSGRLHGLASEDVYIDYHPSLSSIFAGRDVQRFSLPLQGFTVHPDVVGRLSDGDSLYAVEAKGSHDILKGIAQAEVYQYGFHAVFYAIPRSSLSPVVIELTRRKNIGLICVDSECEMVHHPVSTNPEKSYSDRVRRQFNAAVSVKSSNSFLYNLPTHYLFWVSVMDFGVTYGRVSMQSMYAEFGSSESAGFTGAAAGAVRLGLMHRQGDEYTLTEMGFSVQMALKVSIEDWRNVHAALRRKLLIEVWPQAAGILRMLMLHDDKLNLLINGIKRLPKNEPVSYLEIVRECDRLDHDTSMIYFFKPESSGSVLGDDYLIDWEKVDLSHLRPSINYQTKRLMQHAGFIRKSNLNESIWNV